MSAEENDHLNAERIRIRAYMIWEKDGRPDGQALAHWMKAKEEIEAENLNAKTDHRHSASATN